MLLDKSVSGSPICDGHGVFIGYNDSFVRDFYLSSKL